MIGFTLDEAKGMFFDSAKIIGAVDVATRKVLSQFGAFVRRTARTSIRKSKKISKPGEPPKSHSGLLRKFIFFGYDQTMQSVVIGPVRFGTSDASEHLEYGTDSIAIRAQRIIWRVGDYGPIRVGESPSATMTWTEKGKVPIVRTKLTTLGMVRRAQEIHAQYGLYGRPSRNVKLAARPFMRPALRKELPKLPAMWRDSVKP